MTRWMALLLAAVTMGIACSGCSRAVSEGMGVAMGASGKVVDSGVPADLTRYTSLHVQPVTVAPDLRVPPEVPEMIRANLVAAAAGVGLGSQGQPGLQLAVQVIHYETTGVVDSAIGPLAEIIVHATLTDATSGQVVAHANLVGRSKATMSSSDKDLTAAVGKALTKWLREGGLRKAGEKEGQ